MPTTSIFISSVQKELAEERLAVKAFVEGDPLLRRYFTAFLFEDLPASDRHADEVYLDEVDRCAVYIGFFGRDYGFEDAEGFSPTEREFDRATVRGKPRLIFVKGVDDRGRHPKMQALIRKAGSQLIRRRFGSINELLSLLQDSLVEYLAGRGVISGRVFEQRPCPDAVLDDIDPDRLARFVSRARHERQFPLPVRTPAPDVLTHLHLLDDAQPSIAAILLFGRTPQRFVPAAELRCMHFHGTEVQRPAPSYQIFRGNLFEQVDQGADFVLSKLARAVGTRELGPQAPVTYEIPPDVVREAIVNAVAHRDYASSAAVQVSVFANRVEVWNPGELPPELTPARLREPHASIARNARICEALFLARYIEKFGTGTVMMIRECSESGLPEPEFEQRGGEFVVTLWRDRLTEAVIAKLGLNERQKKVLVHLREVGRITNADYQRVSGATRKTSMRDLTDLVKRGLLERTGTRKGAYYRFARKWDIYGTYGTSAGPREKRATKGPKGQRRKRLRNGSKGSQRAQRPHRQTRHKPAKTASVAPAGEGAIKGTSRKMGHKGDKRNTAASRKKSATNAPIAPAAGQRSRRRKKRL